MPVADDESAVVDDELSRIHQWRVERFIGLRFEPSEAEELAMCGADWHTAEQLLNLACPLRLVYTILR